MVTLFLVFIITKGALTLYEGNTIGRGAIRVGDTAQAHTIATQYTGLVYRYNTVPWSIDD